MNRFLTRIATILVASLAIVGCREEAFMDEKERPININNTDLQYPSIVNARAYSEIVTAVPVMSNGMPCTFRIESVRNAEGILDASYLEAVTIASAYVNTVPLNAVDPATGEDALDEDGNPIVYEHPFVDPNNGGQIIIADGNMFGEGDYYFTVEATPITIDGEQTSSSKIFEDAFHLNVMPILPVSLTYGEGNVRQNLVQGASSKTTVAIPSFGKDIPADELNITYELVDNTDKLVIDPQTGEISLNPSYTVTQAEGIYPSIKIISNRTGEEIVFEGGAEFLTIVASLTELDMQKPFLSPALLYSPYGQNLVVGSGESTTTDADVTLGNSEVSFELVDNTDKLVIDAASGAISIKDGYTVTDNETVFPTIKVTSNITSENASFERTIKIVISNEAVQMDKEIFNFFYPTLSNASGHTIKAVQKSGVPDGLFWKAKGAKFLPPGGTDKPVMIHNFTWGTPGASHVHESWMVMDEQNLVQYHSGYDVTANYWIKNDMALYNLDGSAAADIEIYITNNYTGDVTTTDWGNPVNEDVKVQILGEGTVYTGTPYPGDGTGDDPDGKKTDYSRAAYGQWLKCELDLSPYKEYTSFTLAFRYKTSFTGSSAEAKVLDQTNATEDEGNWGNTSGRYYISDVNYKAVEQ